MKPFLKLFVAATVLFVLISCTKEHFTTSRDALLKTSVDTLHFDTVFTTTGSTSQFIKIINENNEGIRISSVKLAGGSASPFRINVDGLPGPQVNEVEVNAHDSSYIYVTVTINPRSSNLPFVVRDSIEISYNGNKQFVQLDAFGQNAHFMRNKQVTGNETWNNDLPYVVLGQLTVLPNATLTINKGVQVHIHADAPFVVQGTLLVNGAKEPASRVVFTGDRLDEPYRDFPASYPGLIFTESSRNNVINYGIIKNAYQGIAIGGMAAGGAKLTLNETIIDNAYEQGIWAINTNINARNLLVSNCGQNIFLFGGGNYNFTHCTVASYSTAYVAHKKPALSVFDYYEQNGVVNSAPLTANFTNCIFWGEANGFIDDEVIVKKVNPSPTVTFNRVLWRMKNPLSATFTNIIGNPINKDPLFDSINTSKAYFDFRLEKKGSEAVNAGINANVFIDLDGNPRPRGTAPDLGAYEKQQ
jgi:hypothetical protein